MIQRLQKLDEVCLNAKGGFLLPGRGFFPGSYLEKIYFDSNHMQ